MNLSKTIRNGIVGLTMLTIAGCSGGGTSNNEPVNQRGYADTRVEYMLDEIKDADMPEWYGYGTELYSRKNIRTVGDSDMSSELNGFSFIPEETIWLQNAMFQRYDRLDQGEILLHELVHCKTKLASHTNYFGQIQEQYRSHYGR